MTAPPSSRGRAGATPAAPEGASARFASHTADDLAGEVEAVVRAQLRRLEVVAGLTEADRAKVQSAALAALSLVSRLRGRVGVVDGPLILRSAAWARIAGAITQALESWPEALTAVGEALRRLGEER